MSILNDLVNHNIWLEFLEYKKNRYISKQKYEKLENFINERKYLSICVLIKEGKYSFSIPKKTVINKRNSIKKRVIYQFNEDENIILKMLTYLLFKNYPIFNDNCYSFRRETTPKQAFLKLVSYNVDNYYVYKLDISNYFNSIDINLLLPMLTSILPLDVYELIASILLEDKVVENDRIITEKKGVMAGTPISCFLANLYLNGLDTLFKNEIYARYADDIIVFAPTYNQLIIYKKTILDYLKKYHLTINPSKEKIYLPLEPWEFLGFSYSNHIIDLSDNTKRKIKHKIHRKARALYRWKIRKNVSDSSTMKAMNKIFNYKFFYGKKGNELNWSLWYFPVITTSKSLKEIDQYYQAQLRYLVTGKHNKANYRKVSYQTLKDNGYNSLVHEYYMYKKIDNKNLKC